MPIKLTACSSASADVRMMKVSAYRCQQSADGSIGPEPAKPAGQASFGNFRLADVRVQPRQEHAPSIGVLILTGTWQCDCNSYS
jgi:hypothetical protein